MTIRFAAAPTVLFLLTSSFAGAVTIDDFSNAQASVSDPGGGATSVAAPAVVGGRRGLAAKLRTGAGPATTSVAGGVLSLAVTATTPDSRGEAVVTWDGDSNANALSFFGTPQSLTTGGHRSFRIRVNSAGAGTELALEVYTDASNSSLAALRLPAVGAPTDFFLSYGPGADFVPRLGTGADFTDVGAIVLTVRGTETTAAIDLVETVGATVGATKRDLDLANAPIVAAQPASGTFRHRVTITNTGGQAVRLDFNDVNTDPNLTLDPATADATPIARNDAYATFGNVPITVSAGANLYDCDPSNGGAGPVGLLSNDCDADTIDEAPADPTELAVTTVGAIVTTLGGSANVAADGSFTYTPPIGAGKAVDTFAYTVVDNDGNSANGTVTINLGPTIWFVDDADPGGANLGNRDDPFITHLPTNVAGVGGAGDQDLPGDILFFYAGAHAGTLPLEADQQLIGEGEGLIIDGMTIVAAGVDPTWTTTVAASHAVQLATNNTIRGFTFGNTTGADIFGTAFGTLTVSNVVLNGTGQALDLTNGTANATFESISSTNSSGRGISLDNVSGTVTATSGTTVTNSAQAGIRVANGTGSPTYNFGATSVTGTDSQSALDLTTNATAAFTFASLAVTTDAAAGLVANNSGTLDIGGAANTIVANGGAAVDLTSTSLGTGARFSTVSSSGSPGRGLNLDTVTGDFIANGGAIGTAAGIDFDVNAGSSTITYAGSITNTANRSIEITGRTGGTVTLSGNISDTGTGINVANNSVSGTPIINLSGASKVINTGANAAVTLDNNDVAAINFTGGGLDIDTTSGAGFNAINGASAISVQGTGNSITSTTGTALNVVSSAIAAAGLTFQSISSNGGTSGVVLDATGASGSLTVTGAGSAGSGGTIQNKVIGISLTSTQNPSFSWMQLNDFSDYAIRGTTVTGFTMTRTAVTGANGNSAPAHEGSVIFDNLFGIGSITHSTISGGIEDNLRIENTSGTLTSFTLSGSGGTSSSCQILNNNGSTGNVGFRFAAFNSATMTAVVQNCLFRGNRTDTINIDAANDSMVTSTVTNNYILGGTAGNNQGNLGINVTSGGTSAQHTTTVSNNFVGTDGVTHAPLINTGINLFAGNDSTLTAKVTDNIIRHAGSGSGHGIQAAQSLDSTMNVRIDGNTVSNVALDYGIYVHVGLDPSAAGTSQFGILNNNVSVLSTAADAIRARVRSGGAGQGCGRITGNTATQPGAPTCTLGGLEFPCALHVSRAGGATYNLEGGTAGLASGNPGIASNRITSFGTINTVAANSCTSIPPP